MLELKPKVAKNLAGQLIARIIKPGAHAHIYLVSRESGNLFSFVI